VFFLPDMRGYFLEDANYEPANALQTPPHIRPMWYFTPFYAILRAVPNKLFGVVLMGRAAIASNQRFKAGKWPRSYDCISQGTIQGYTARSAME
jgi:hypothetical protein